MNVVKYANIYMNLIEPTAYILTLKSGADQNNRYGFNKSFYLFTAFNFDVSTTKFIFSKYC